MHNNTNLRRPGFVHQLLVAACQEIDAPTLGPRGFLRGGYKAFGKQGVYNLSKRKKNPALSQNFQLLLGFPWFSSLGFPWKLLSFSPPKTWKLGDPNVQTPVAVFDLRLPRRRRPDSSDHHTKHLPGEAVWGLGDIAWEKIGFYRGKREVLWR